ncbi:hypothetical protein LXA43DRAFT_1005877 [Ganoderma leucocontextum]|nr:hypothetical protein LXA43DRAFT_1005877 [Ganoderma leucocontextum]
MRGTFSIFNEDIAATHERGLPYILGETNSIACHGVPGASNTAGMALWVIAYTLQASTLGIKQLFFHEGIGFKYNFVSLRPRSCVSLYEQFQPVRLNRPTIDGSPIDPPQPPHVQPAYYGHPHQHLHRAQPAAGHRAGRG